MTTNEITRWIMRRRWHRSFVLPRFTPLDWWECDVFEVSHAGYFREYEIKVSLADFQRDADKHRIAGWREPNAGDRESKHELLARGDPRGPCEFYFVCPAGVIPHRLVPSFAGLLEFHDGRCKPVRVIEAPRLHRKKLRPEILDSARGACYGRYHAAIGTT